ncbi:taurine ABC transporter substrate-binding protein [Nocardiopsis ansamitocini]|uniref:Glycine/betaine ABC transporter substrate-binding protein n=1 Tax=Nocardiopsis ansamitocini TaxID=1670832 RepID=A0A9W6UGL7_9ACTN|nr:ABC transporter substrate-binding protein [Nocardiopsis ansamitocini]GLU45692.1 glycine/betaine ABC transporter substrate-binding protein [Nocardiopsis ansamitocini]
MSPRPTSRTALAAALAATLLLGSACGADPAADPADGIPGELRIGYQSIPNGDLIVKNQGWLEEALPDTTVTWNKFDSGGDVNTAFLAGELDIALAGSAPVTRGLSQPLDIGYQVPWIHDVIDDNEALVAVDGIDAVADLEGRTVAVPFASTTHYHLIAALDEAGLEVGDVELLDLEPPDIQAAWQRGDVDAAFVWYPVLGQLYDEGGHALVTSGELARRGKVTADLAVVATGFAEDYPDALAEWVAQQDRAVTLLRDDKQTAVAAIAAELNLEPAQAEEQVDQLVFLTAAEQASADYLGTSGEPGRLAEYLGLTAEFLAEQGEIETAPDRSLFEAALLPTGAESVAGG